VMWVPEVRARSVGVLIGVVWVMTRSRTAIFLWFCRYFRKRGTSHLSLLPVTVYYGTFTGPDHQSKRKII
jgi:hypothetical protein